MNLYELIWLPSRRPMSPFEPYRTPAFAKGFELLRLCTISIIVADIKTVRLSKTVGLNWIDQSLSIARAPTNLRKQSWHRSQTKECTARASFERPGEQRDTLK
jgi:hypothetical protein